MSKYTSLLGNKEAELLETLGLSKSELSVYLAALELGEANAQDISRKSGIKRTSLYNFLDNLKGKQLILEIRKGKKRMYSAANPSYLLQMEKSRTEFLERVIPELMAINNIARKKPRVFYHEGIGGIREIYNEMLRDKQNIYAWEDLDSMVGLLPSAFIKDYPMERSAKKIPLRSVTRDTPFARKFTAENNVRLYRDSRFISSDKFGTDIEIFGNKVALFSLRKDAPFGVLIEDDGIARTLKIIWQKQWEQLGDSSK